MPLQVLLGLAGKEGKGCPTSADLFNILFKNIEYSRRLFPNLILHFKERKNQPDHLFIKLEHLATDISVKLQFHISKST